jgi:agmatine deiminase
MNRHLQRRFPAEWEEQDAVLLAWPHHRSDWATLLNEAERVYGEIIAAILRRQTVILTTPDPAGTRETLAAAGIDSPRLKLYQLPSNDTWARDFGPLCVFERGKPQLLDFTFNGWGNKFPADLDNRISAGLQRLGAFGATPLREEELVLEGGSIESDGQGTLLTTSDCLLEKNRNPRLNREQLDALLRDRFGARQVLWLGAGRLSGDDTDSHIDTLARFAPERTILYQGCDNPADEHFLPLQEMAAQLGRFRDLDGQPYRLRELPLPQPILAGAGYRLPAGYANFLVINGAVLVPTYNDPADRQALAIIGEAFPGREVIGIDCRTLIRQHGSLHCVTMQIPKGVL